jgi:hypothetical protein
MCVRFGPGHNSSNDAARGVRLGTFSSLWIEITQVTIRQWHGLVETLSIRLTLRLGHRPKFLDLYMRWVDKLVPEQRMRVYPIGKEGILTFVGL